MDGKWPARFTLVAAAVVSAMALAGVHSTAKRAPHCRHELTDRMQKEHSDAEAFTAKSLEAELLRQGLTRVELPEQVVGEGLQPPGTIAQGSDGADYLVTGHLASPFEEITPTVFVENPRHELYIADLQPKMISDKRYVVCGCARPGSGVEMPSSYGVRIQKDRPIKGHLPIVYRAKRVTIDATEPMPAGIACPK